MRGISTTYTTDLYQMDRNSTPIRKALGGQLVPSTRNDADCYAHNWTPIRQDLKSLGTRPSTTLPAAGQLPRRERSMLMRGGLQQDHRLGGTVSISHTDLSDFPGANS